jgi:ribosomal-protein-alanine N-acetyltransferase
MTGSSGNEKAIAAEPLPEMPTLRAGSVLLRPFRYSDLPCIREAAADPYIPLVTTIPVPFTEQEGLQFIERQNDRLRRGFGYSFAIAAMNDLAVGSIKLRFTNIKDGRASVGYWITPSQRGRHFASQALVEIVR